MGGRSLGGDNPGTLISEMKTVIQNCKTKFFVGENSEWLSSFAEARAFENTLAALSYCQAQRLRNVQIVMTFGMKEYDVCLPVLDPRQAVAA